MSASETLKRTSPEQHNAYLMIAKTSHSFFLTGKAGTGKTTFLRKICKEVPKNFLLLAPTGLAAMSLGGQTIHSFFGFKFGVLGPSETGVLGPDKTMLIKHIDTIIIDEVSMVRCDLIDAIDRTLRHYRKSSAPFGGIQMVFSGDMFQLEPVVQIQDRAILEEIYQTDRFYFYKSFVIKHYDLPKIEFRNIYRQSDPIFIELLERFRTGNVTTRDVMRLNSRHIISDPKDETLRITLTANNKTARKINDERMKQIEGAEFTYIAHSDGDTRNLKDIVENELTLKVGAQVMFIRNDSFGRWVNGTLATVCSLSDNGISVYINDLQGEKHDLEIAVERVTWEVAEQVYDKESKSCIRKVVGRVNQYPLRPAWAITIHKSQGLTFDKVAIDLGSGSFACGQTYVALSRARSLEGIELIHQIYAGAAIVSRDVMEFAAGFNNCDQIYKQIQIGEAIYDHIISNDFDSASKTLYTMARKEVAKGNLDNACYMMSNAMSYLADDSCLKGLEWTSFESENYSHQLLNAFGLFYNGHAKESQQILQKSENIAICQNFDAQYLLARCQEENGEWDQMWMTYDMLTALYLESRDKGLDSTSFRKFKYRMALLREKHGKGPGAGIIRELIAENPDYDIYFRNLRWMLWNNEEAMSESENSDNMLVKTMFDKNIEVDQFISMLDIERESKTNCFISFRKFINGLKLALGY